MQQKDGDIYNFTKRVIMELYFDFELLYLEHLYNFTKCVVMELYFDFELVYLECL
jgi:hypothetical protein